MKSVFLSVVVVCALAIAGIGGTFATWSDSETSMGNTIETGSVDLMVNGADDEPWGEGVPTKVTITCMQPCKWYGPFEVELWNASQDCMPPAHAYIHFKDGCCGNAPPKEGSGYACPETGDLKPEPELVAEFGGRVNCRMVDGIGRTGDDCSMLSHVEVIVTDAEGYTIVGPVALVDIWSDEIYLFDLPACTPTTINLWFHLIQESEEDYGFDYFADPEDPGFDELEWLKFNDWPSWALMKDTVVFSIEFDLWLEDPTELAPGK
jgi:predicted ribosomally synthesized peptide with SipW-like signal peptide